MGIISVIKGRITPPTAFGQWVFAYAIRKEFIYE